VNPAGPIATTPSQCGHSPKAWAPEVALKATWNAWAIATMLSSHAARMVVSNPAMTRAIAKSRVKTDQLDAAILARLLGAE
jgi:transposase